MHWRFNLKLIIKVRLYILDHAFAVGSAEQICFTNEDHGIRAGLIKRLYDDQVVLRKPGTGIDQHDPEVAAR